MNEESGTKRGTDMDEAVVMDAQGAAAVLQQARDRARRELAVRRPVLFLIWGVVVFVGYGAMWLSVRGQHPYHGPAWQALLLAFLLFLAAAGASANVLDQAASGVGGRSELQRGIFAVALLAGFAALELEKQALVQAGASRPLAALLGEAIPLLTAGLVLVASCAVTGRLDWPRLIIGSWLLAVAVGGAWAGVVTNLAVCALAGGAGIVLMAIIEPRLRRS
jgi:hypothetical protein